MILKRFFVSLSSTLKYLSKTMVIKKKSFGKHKLNEMANCLPFVVNDQLIVMIKRDIDNLIIEAL